MPLLLSCPGCGIRATLPEASEGQSVRCPQCRHKFKVTSATETKLPQDSRAKETQEEKREKPQAPSTLRDIAEGDILGRFKIQGELGRGAFGCVYQAHDNQLDRAVALKVPHPSTLDNPKAIARFLREGKSAAQLQHPNLVEVLDAGEDQGYYYLASAFINGKTLSEARKSEDINSTRAAIIVRELAEGLSYAHQRGIVHRDVKSANVMLDEEGHALLMDFGLAHRTDVEERLTLDGAVLGTPAYMAPEQAKGQQGDPIPASDQYSLGVILYELLCGQLPFEGPPEIVMFQVINEEPTAPRKVNGAIDRDLETICLKAMSKEPNQRYENCEALADDLRRWLDSEPIEARRLNLFEKTLRFVRREKLIAGVLLLVIGSLLTVSFIAQSMAAKLRDTEQSTAHYLEVARKNAEDAEKSVEITRKEQQRAEAEQRIATEQEKRAKERADAAAKAEKEANDKAVEARIAFKKAAENSTEGLRYLYRVDLARVQIALFENDRNKAKSILMTHIPKAGINDIRDYDWYRHWGCLHSKELIPLKYMNDDGWPIAFSLDGEKAILRHSSSIEVWDISEQRSIYTVPDQSKVWSAAFATSSSTFAFGTEEGIIEIHHSSSRRMNYRIQGHQKPVTSLSFSSDATMIVAGYQDGTVQLLELGKDEPVNTFPKMNSEVFAVAITEDKLNIAAGGFDGSIALYNVATTKQRMLPTLHSGMVSTLRYSPNGLKLASGGWDGKIVVWKNLQPNRGKRNNLSPVPTTVGELVTTVAINDSGGITKQVTWSSRKGMGLWLDVIRERVASEEPDFTIPIPKTTLVSNKPQTYSGSLSSYLKVGNGYLFEVEGKKEGSVWGTEVYTTDSSLEAVVVHAGLLEPKERAIVRVDIVPTPRLGFRGSKQNGIQSSEYESYPKAFRVSLVKRLTKPRVVVLDDPGDLTGYQYRIGKTFLFKVKGSPGTNVLFNGSSGGFSSFPVTDDVTGTGYYHTSSNLSLTAVHAGALKPGQTGILQVRIYKAPRVFKGSKRHGVVSKSAYGSLLDQSTACFKIVNRQLIKSKK